VTTKQLQALNCVVLPHDGIAYLRQDTDIDCDSDSHKRFAEVNFLLIGAYLLVPAAWLFLLHREKSRLLPPAVEDPDQVALVRAQDPNLAALRFLFKDYRPSLYYFEAIEMLRRVLLCGGISMVTTSTLQRGMIGQVLSLASVVAYREVMPFRVGFASVLAHVAQIVVFLTFSAAVVIETGVGDAFEPLLFGAGLCLTNLAVTALTMFTSHRRHLEEERELRRKREARVTKVEWACNFTANKFRTTFTAVVESSVPASHALVFFYASLAEIRQVLRSGLAVAPGQKGVVVTLHRFHDLTEEDKAAFPCLGAFVACVVPKRMLFAKSPAAAVVAAGAGGGSSALRLLRRLWRSRGYAGVLLRGPG
jgi:hypothetical protein